MLFGYPRYSEMDFSDINHDIDMIDKYIRKFLELYDK